MNILPYLLIIVTGLFSGSVFVRGRYVMTIILAATASLSTAQTYAVFYVWIKQYESAVVVAVLLILSNLLGGVVQMHNRINHDHSESS